MKFRIAILCIVGLVYSSLANSYWETYGRDKSGTRFSPLKKINTTSVDKLASKWSWISEEYTINAKQVPVVTDDGTGRNRTLMLFGNNWNDIYALDAVSGEFQWKSNVINPTRNVSSSGYYIRSLTAWLNPKLVDGQLCRKTIFVAVKNLRIAAIDGSTGQLCPHFGVNGIVNYPDINNTVIEEFEMNSKGPVVIVNGVLVAGMSMADGKTTNTPKGPVWAFNATSGEKLWKFDPIPLDASDPTYYTWWNGTENVGAANVWAAMSGDEEEGLVFMATSSPSLDAWGGNRWGPNVYSDTLVAIKALTGKVAWYYQTVHHDIWDYDIASQPVVTKVRGRRAVVIGTKTAMIFAFDIRTGEPLVDISQVPVNPTFVVGEWVSPTQPFVEGDLTLNPRYFTEENLWSVNEAEKDSCRDWYMNVTGRQNGHMYTPQSPNGSFMHPGPLGGISFGGCASNPKEESVYCVVSYTVEVQMLFPRSLVSFPSWCTIRAEQLNAPYKYCRGNFVSRNKHPCIKPPWQTLVKANMTTGRVIWRVPIGYDPASGYNREWGSRTHVGGVSVTESGLVLITGTQDNHLWIYNSNTGEVLRNITVRQRAYSTPITYIINDVEYIGVFSGDGSVQGGIQVFGLQSTNEDKNGLSDGKEETAIEEWTLDNVWNWLFNWIWDLIY